MSVRLGDLGFEILPRRGWRSLALAAGLGLVFGAYMALADRFLFASVVPQVQHTMLAQMTTVDRLLLFARGALIDEVELRLVALTVIAWGIANLFRTGDGRVHRAAILLVAFVIYPLASWNYFRFLDPSALTILREVALHGAAGTLWGWLYWRHGWLSGLTGHVSAHLALQPLLGAM